MVGPSARQRRIGAEDAVGTLDHGTLEAARLHRDVLGEEAGDGDARRRIRAGIARQSGRRQRLLGQERAARGGREQAQIGGGAGERGVLLRSRPPPLRGALQAVALLRPVVRQGGPVPGLAEVRAEVARLSEALKEMGVRLMLAEGKERWD